jgi:hypothetical protein
MAKVQFVFKDGKLTVDVEGMRGSGCEKLADELVREIITRKIDQDPKSDYFDDGPKALENEMQF